MAERTHPGLSGLLSDLNDVEKVQAAKDVAATIESPGWGRIVHLLDTLKVKLLDELVGQRAVKSQADYAAALAEVRGLETVVHISRSVLSVGERSARQLSESERAS